MKPLIEESNQTETEREADSALVYRAWDGDLEALGLLYDRYSRLVYSIALKSLHSVAEAEDLTQEVFMTLARSRTYNPQRGALAKYLTTLTRSRAIDRLRARATQQKYLNQWNQQQMATEATTPLTKAMQQERRTLVRAALSTLKARQREVLELSYYEGQSQSDIAKRLGVPLGTVKSWARRGLLQLKEQLLNPLEDSGLS
ncbi:MAG: sigma-70 family RNA polymerase sigma factor [Cyanobacteria bacterium J06598_1]